MTTFKSCVGQWAKVALDLETEGFKSLHAKEIADRYWQETGALPSMIEDVKDRMSDIRQKIEKDFGRTVCTLSEDFFKPRDLGVMGKNGKPQKASFKAAPPDSLHEAIQCIPRGQRPAVGIYFPTTVDDLIYQASLKAGAARLGGASNTLFKRIANAQDQGILEEEQVAQIASTFQDKFSQEELNQITINILLPVVLGTCRVIGVSKDQIERVEETVRDLLVENGSSKSDEKQEDR